MTKGYIAMSADGYIADAAGGAGWLERFGADDFAFAAFLATIDTVVMGRATFDQVIAFGGEYPYAGKRSIVVTSSSLPAGAPAAEAWHDGIASLAAMLAGAAGNASIVGAPGCNRPSLPADRLIGCACS